MRCILYIIVMIFAFDTASVQATVGSAVGKIYTLRLADLSVMLSEDGGRVVSFKRAGRELLTQRDVHPNYHGATFWLSPQLQNWPASVEIDRGLYKVTHRGDTLVMTSKPDQRTGVIITKRFAISAADTSLSVVCILTNGSLDTVSVAPWDVLRAPKGVSFFPAGEANPINQLGIAGATFEGGMVWCNTSEHAPERGEKLFHTASNGWLAHYVNGLLLVKCFPDITPDELPPAQGEAEIYIAPKGRYVELENHGRYLALPSGVSMEYKQQWYLRFVGDHLDAKSLMLVDLLGK